MPTVEQVRIILERTFGFPVLESDAQIVFDRLVDLARKEAVEHSAHPTYGTPPPPMQWTTPEGSTPPVVRLDPPISG